MGWPRMVIDEATHVLEADPGASLAPLVPIWRTVAPWRRERPNLRRRIQFLDAACAWWRVSNDLQRPAATVRGIPLPSSLRRRLRHRPEHFPDRDPARGGRKPGGESNGVRSTQAFSPLPIPQSQAYDTTAALPMPLLGPNAMRSPLLVVIPDTHPNEVQRRTGAFALSRFSQEISRLQPRSGGGLDGSW